MSEAPEIELAVIVGTFDARTGREGDVAAVLARYVVLTRRRPGCRNVDLVASVLHPGRFVVVEKWDAAEAPRDHLDAPETVAMAESLRDLLAGPPALELCESISAYDLE